MAGYIKIIHQYVRSITYEKTEIARIIGERFKQHERRYHDGDCRQGREGMARKGFDQQPQNRDVETSWQVSSNPSKMGQRLIQGEGDGNTSSLQRRAPLQPSPSRHPAVPADQINPRLPPADLMSLIIRLDKIEGELKRQPDEDGQGLPLRNLWRLTKATLRSKKESMESRDNSNCSARLTRY